MMLFLNYVILFYLLETYGYEANSPIEHVPFFFLNWGSSHLSLFISSTIEQVVPFYFLGILYIAICLLANSERIPQIIMSIYEKVYVILIQ